MTGQEFTTNEILRLEVEQPPGILKNLIQNPNGALGAWGWVSVATDSAMTSFDGITYNMTQGTRKTTGQVLITIPGNHPGQRVITVRHNTYLADGVYNVVSSTVRVVGGVVGTVTDFYIADSATASVDTEITSGEVDLLPYLRFSRSTTGFTNFSSVDIAAKPGVNYRARLDIRSMTAGHNITVSMYFYDANREFLGSAPFSAPTSSGTVYVDAFTAPANTALMHLQVSFRKTPAAQVDAGAYVEFNRAMIGEGGTAGAQSRTNEYGNPSLETNLNGFTADAGTTLSRTTADKMFGSYSMNVSVGTKGKGFEFTGDWFTTTKNTNYTFSFYVKSSIARNIRIDKRNSDGSGNHFKTQGPTVALAANVWTRYVWTFNTGNYYTDRFNFVTSSTNGAGGTYRIDGILMEEATSALQYFDGSIIPAGYTSSTWNGTAHDSSSTAHTAAAVFDYSDPQVYANILGSSVEIGIQRSELDVGTLQASIRDSELDPSVADTIRPGRKFRLSVHKDDVWEPVLLGTIANAKVTYDLANKDQSKRANIVLTATDYITDLANTSRTEGVTDIDELPHVLEGVSVPWNVNGNTGHVEDATVAYTADNASALDMVGVTRDTQRGFAWVSRQGILNVYDAAAMSNVAVSLDETIYNPDIDIDYDTDRCINEINIKALRIVGDQTEEWSFGPYRNAVSIREWGSHSATFTVAAPPGAVLNDAYFASFVNGVFASNAVPQVRVNSLTIRIRSLADLQYALLDLYDLVEVTNANAGITAQPLRITGINHRITPDQWLVTLSFAANGGIASPAITPQIGNPTDAEGWINIPLASGYEGGETGVPQYRVKNGIVFLRGSVQQSSTGTLAINTSPGHTIGTLPEEARPAGADIVTVVPPQNPSTHASRMFVWTNGTVKVYLNGLPREDTTGYVTTAAAYVSLYAVYPAGA